jgi:two-component system sensor histidine kinase CreC
MVRRAVDTLRSGVHEMRDALTGRNYVADYVQTFTHEIKSPLSAIRGAAELIQEPSMPQAERERFLGNIAHETQRIQEIVDRMMELTALETRRALERSENVTAPLPQDIAAGAQAAAAKRDIRVNVAIHNVGARATLLLRRAVSNLPTTPSTFALRRRVLLALETSARQARISVRDRARHPDYAKDKVFEKPPRPRDPTTRRRARALAPPREGDRDAASRSRRTGECTARRRARHPTLPLLSHH